MTSTTERLREMLDERGIKHNDHYTNTSWRDVDGVIHVASEQTDKTIILDYLTPEQVVAATLGSGECENIAKHWGEFECSECSFYADFGSDLHRVRSCPDCGKAVKR